MFIISVIISSIVIGYLASTLKDRFPIWLYMLVAFVGALIGGAISFGDSPLFLSYPILNIWTVPALFAVLFVVTTLFADRRKIVANIITDLLIIGLILFILFAGGSTNNYSSLFGEELQRTGVERVGQPIEGFSAFMYLEAFPGFEASDFDGVESLEGIYQFIDNGLEYERTAGNPVTSAEDVISSDGYTTLLNNFSKRVGVEVRVESDIATILKKLHEGDEEKVSYIHEDFSIWSPQGWYPYENGSGVFFVRDANLEIPQSTDGFALGPYFQVTVERISAEELFAQNLWTEGSEFLVSRDDVRIRNNEGIRIVTQAAGASGEVLHYVIETTDERTFVLSHYPFERGSTNTDDFERAVQSFMINYTDAVLGNPTSADDAPPGSIHNLPVPDAVSAVKKHVAEQSGVREGLVIVMTAYEKEWSDGCLGLGGPAEGCIAVITPGYEVTVSVNGTEQRYRTNADGTQIRKEK